jgi:hypothetical protein
MKEVKGNMWSYLGRKGFIICITTNGFIKTNGEGVMGAGCAKEAMDQFPDLPRLLGLSLKSRGLHVSRLTQDIISFPVKYKWFEKAHPKLIKQSVKELKQRAEERPKLKFILPRPGCGNGGLKYHSMVKPLLKDLPNNVFVIGKEGEE